MQPKRVAILQSCYIPWRGYFDIINMVDEFIIFDDVQFTKRDWRTRNKIKTRDGSKWLTIPVKTKGKYHQNICDVEVVDTEWAKKHWNTIYHSYRGADKFELMEEKIAGLYEQCADITNLSQINKLFIDAVCEMLGIQTKITYSKDYGANDVAKGDRILAICKNADATNYLTGPLAKDYIDPEEFKEANIELEYMSYDGYSDYQQLFGEFDPNVTVLDLLFNMGLEAPKYMKSMNR